MELIEHWLDPSTNINIAHVQGAFAEEINHIGEKAGMNHVFWNTKIKTLNTDEPIFLALPDGTIIISRVEGFHLANSN